MVVLYLHVGLGLFPLAVLLGPAAVGAGGAAVGAGNLVNSKYIE